MVILNDDDKHPPESRDSRIGKLAVMVEEISEQYALLAVVQAQVSTMLADLLDHATANRDLFVASDTDTTKTQEVVRSALAGELAAKMRLSQPMITSMLGTAETLTTELPATLEALGEGVITYQHARTLIDQATGLSTQDRAAFEQVALKLAKTSTPPQFKNKALALRESLHPETSTERHEAAAEDRRVEHWNAPDGMGWLALYAPVEVTQSIFNACHTTAKSLRKTGDQRTIGQLTADVFTDAAMLGLTTGIGTGGSSDDSGEGAGVPVFAGRDGAIRPTVHVTVPVMTLLGHSEEPAELDGYGPINPETARRLAAQAPSFTRLLTHPETGAVLSVGRDRYAVPADLRKTIEVRDKVCGFPGCNRSARQCDVDHILAWQDGGETDLENLNCLCRRHHVLKHSSTWQVQRDDDGTIIWTSPLGQKYRIRRSTNVGFVPLDECDETPEPDIDDEESENDGFAEDAPNPDGESWFTDTKTDEADAADDADATDGKDYPENPLF
ncbi:HNH endonuclease [Paramicrobacterium humi]|uniref:HNH endonuclease n=2 Tax=Paramicrobacterium humi TaxID=640635 RepID=A0A1H4LAW3_9MICO|nr:HNH endonuclease [Microbacterium humi]